MVAVQADAGPEYRGRPIIEQDVRRGFGLEMQPGKAILRRRPNGGDLARESYGCELARLAGCLVVMEDTPVGFNLAECARKREVQLGSLVLCGFALLDEEFVCWVRGGQLAVRTICKGKSEALLLDLWTNNAIVDQQG